MSDPSVAVRDATVDDASAIAAVHVRSWQVAYRGQLPGDLLDNLSVERRTQGWGVRWWEQAGPTHRLLVAEEAGAVVGFAALGPSRDRDAKAGIGELIAIYAAPEAWGRGVGRELMGVALDAGQAAGFRELTLWVLETNVRARHFYEVAGWQTDGGRQAEEIGGVVAVEVRYRRML